MDRFFTIRCSSDDFDGWKFEAEQRGVSVGEWVRCILYAYTNGDVDGISEMRRQQIEDAKRDAAARARAMRIKIAMR